MVQNHCILDYSVELLTCITDFPLAIEYGKVAFLPFPYADLLMSSVLPYKAVIAQSELQTTTY